MSTPAKLDQIMEILAKKFIEDYKQNRLRTLVKIMLKDLRILDMDEYLEKLDNHTITQEDALMYIYTRDTIYYSTFNYPFLYNPSIIINAYLSKLSFKCNYPVVPGSGIRYVTAVTIDTMFDVEEFRRKFKGYDQGLREIGIEIIDLDKVVKNTNLDQIFTKIVKRELTDDDYKKIYEEYTRQKLFYGYDFEEAFEIIHRCMDKTIEEDLHCDKYLDEIADRIKEDYERIFQPYAELFYFRVDDDEDEEEYPEGDEDP